MITPAISKQGRDARWAEVKTWSPGKRRCRGRCKRLLPLLDFHQHKSGYAGRYPICKSCRKPIERVQRSKTSIEVKLYNSAKARAKKLKLEFNIVVADIVIPAVCPVFGVLLVYKTKYAPSLDRKNSALGYTKENIQVISKRANTLKNNGTLEEFQTLIRFLEKF